MYLFYYVWGFFLYIFSLTHKQIQNFFIAYNSPYLMSIRIFRFLSYFEKLFLVLFYRKGWFEKSLAHLFRTKDIEDYRRKNYPLINLFHLYLDKSDYKLENLKILSNQYNFFFHSKIFGPKLKRVFSKFFYLKDENFLKFIILQKIFFINYWNTHSFSFFNNQSQLNTYNLNLMFNTFLYNASNRFVMFNLNNWEDWYNYVFGTNIIRRYKVNVKKNIYAEKSEKIRKRRERRQRLEKLIKLIKNYRTRYIKFSKLLNKKYPNLVSFRFSFSNFFKLSVNKDFNKLLKKYYLIRFGESSITKFINASSLKNYSFFYLRKNRIFNKGRYSRNRQLYRTGVYWCLWLNIIMVYGLYFMFYRFSFNFGYIWWGILILAYSTIFSRIVKYNFFNPFYVYREFLSLQRWYGYILKVWMYNFDNFLKNHFLTAILYSYIYRYQKSTLNIFFKYYYSYTSRLFFWWLKKKENMKIKYLWQGMKEIDKSFLRYKTVLHWIKEIYRMFTTW